MKISTIKEDIAIVTATASLLSGIGMCFLAFFLSETHHIDVNALWYFGECLVYAGSIFGIKEYIDFKFGSNHLKFGGNETQNSQGNNNGAA